MHPAPFDAQQRPTGLTEAEARQRLAAEGANELPAGLHRSPLRIVLEVVREPMFALLLGAGVIYLVLGDWREALALLAFACLSVGIAVVQQGRSERVLEALQDLSSPRALVVRDGQRRRVAGREVVRGDLLVLAEGDRVPADAQLVSGDHLKVDESLLTGESVPVRKRPSAQLPTEPGSPGGDDLPHVYSGTLVVAGTGMAVVTGTGARSELGKLGKAVAAIVPETPRLQVQTRRAVLVFAALGLAFSAVLVIVYALIHGAWIEALLGGIALAMSMLPEEFPLVLTVFVVMGAWRLSRSRVLTRRAAAIETLGAATVLCTDKTGTLTRNVMSVSSLQGAAHHWERGEGPEALAREPELQALLRSACLAGEREALDPMERALHDLAVTALPPAARASLVHEYPWLPSRPAVIRAWRETGGALCIAAKGAPEEIARLCGLPAAERDALRLRIDGLATRGLRVLGVAIARPGEFASGVPPEALGLSFLGLVAFADPLRAGVPAAVEECRSAGIRVVMITGDYPETARAIAAEAGIESREVTTGEQLRGMSETELVRRVRSAGIFARIAPEQKLRIVNALKAAGEVVAMTGDGVNDAPALKAAHIGVAMGGRGTDVAREASSIVLLDDDFGSIVQAVRIGRRIYDNLRKAIGYIVAIHLPIAGLALMPVLFGLPLLLTPILIAFLELIIDPACSIAFEAEPEERNLMRRPPRDPRASLLSLRLIAWSMLQGSLALASAVGVFLVVQGWERPEAELRTLALMSLMGINVVLIFVNRTFGASAQAAFGGRNPALWYGLAAVGAALGAILVWGDARAFFGLGALRATDLLVCAIAALALFAGLQLLKALRAHAGTVFIRTRAGSPVR